MSGSSLSARWAIGLAVGEVFGMGREGYNIEDGDAPTWTFSRGEKDVARVECLYDKGRGVMEVVVKDVRGERSLGEIDLGRG